MRARHYLNRHSERDRGTSSVTIYLDEYLKGVLHAEAVAADKSISTLVREWLEEQLDLPAPA